jgi:hypothetical protein
MSIHDICNKSNNTKSDIQNSTMFHKEHKKRDFNNTEVMAQDINANAN